MNKQTKCVGGEGGRETGRRGEKEKEENKWGWRWR